jgi:nitrite reductase/ring-hydroxylating ferredoxin subunit
MVMTAPLARMPSAPPFPDHPATWYRFGHSHQLRHRPLSRDMLGRRLVGYRTAGGRAVVMDARCSHLGADLGRGCVVGDAIQCPFHHWEYGPDGRCRKIPTADPIPARARQAVFPTVERHGHVFFFNAPEPHFPLPFFFDEDADGFVAGRPFRFVADCAWYMLAANGFDAAHFAAVHSRSLIGPPRVDCPAPFARRMRFRARITGDSVFDRLLHWFVGDPVDVSITSWGGPLILVSGFFRKARSYIWIATQPLPAEQTLVEVIVLTRRRGWPARAVEPLALWLRRLFTQGFMQDDIDRLGGIRYNPAGLIETDQLLREYFSWAADLLPGWPDAPRLAAGSQVNGVCLAD